MNMRCIDFFCGGGGMTTAAVMAGLEPVFVANHWETAVRTHELNHPGVKHVVQDLMLYDFSLIPDHEVFLASPSCQGFSNARGRDRKHHDALRATMWCVVSCAEMHRQPFIVVENVMEVLQWELWPSWLHAMKAMGYHVTVSEVDAADLGVPQNRVRAFILCTLNKHTKPVLQCQPQQSVRDHIDWGYANWSPIHKPGRSPKVLQQIERARLDLAEDSFLIPYYGSGSGLTGRSLDRPCGTLVAQDVWAVVRGDEMRMLQPHEYKAIMGFPDSYKLCGTRRDQIRMLGNAVCPPAMRDFLQASLGA